MPMTQRAWKKFRGRKDMKKRRTRRSTAAKANTALKMVKKINRSIEYKRQIADLSVPEEIELRGNTYDLLQGLERGDSSASRAGNRITLARLKYMLRVNFVDEPDMTVHYRVVVLRGLREGGRGISASYFLNKVNGVFDDGVAGDKPLWLVKRKADDNRRDSKILFDRTYTLAPGTVTSKVHNWNFKLGWNTQFRVPYAAEPTEDYIEDGGIYIMIIASDEKLQCIMESVITYSDL